MRGPTDVTVLADGGLLIADTGNHAIRHVDTSGVIRTVAGTGQPGDDGDGLAATESRLRTPGGVMQDAAGALLFADTGNHRVRTIRTAPATTTLTGAVPAGPANENRPQVRGVAEPGTTVHLYADPACEDPVLGSGPATALAGEGIAIEVADDSTTTVHAVSVDAGGAASPCSVSSVTFVEDSTPPAAPDVELLPVTAGFEDRPQWRFTTEASTSATCRLAGATGHPPPSGLVARAGRIADQAISSAPLADVR